MPIERFKDVKIGEREFRIGLVTATVGDWITRALRSGMAAYGQDGYQRMNNYLLSEVSIYREVKGARVPMKIFSGGEFMVKDLELDYDLRLLRDITEAAMEFNFGDFFREEIRREEAAKERMKAEAARISGTVQ